MTARDFATRYIEESRQAWKKGNFKGLERLVHRDVVYHYTPIGQGMVGWEEFKQHIVGGCQALPGLLRRGSALSEHR